MSPQAGEIAGSDSSPLRPGVSCATTADERQSKMKCILPDVNTANCQSPQSNQSSSRKEKGGKGEKKLSLAETPRQGQTNGKHGKTGWNCGALPPTEGGSLVPKIRKDWAVALTGVAQVDGRPPAK